MSGEYENDRHWRYATGEFPEVGDHVQCAPDEGSFPDLREGEEYTVTEIDSGYLFLDGKQGWWPTRLDLLFREGEHPKEPTMPEKPQPSFAPVYAAACYPEFAVIARKHGWALAVHGSLARDFDLIAIPWVENPGTPDQVLDEITATYAVNRIGGWTDKPHGRRAFTLAVGFGQCAIDLQFMPVAENPT